MDRKDVGWRWEREEGGVGKTEGVEVFEQGEIRKEIETEMCTQLPL